MQVVAKYAFRGDPAKSELKFEAGSVIQVTPEGHVAPRHGWMHGSFQYQQGWFPADYVEQQQPPIAAATMPIATATATSASMTTMPIQQQQPVNPMAATAPPMASAIPITQIQPIPVVTPPKPLSDTQVNKLVQQGYTKGLALSLNDTIKTFAKRIWIVDNSGSMQTTDGHRLVETHKRHQVKFVECSRWEEICECVSYHIQLAALLQAPTSFRFLNDPGANVGPQQFSIDTTTTNAAGLSQTTITTPEQAQQMLRKARPGGCTPLTDHILAIHAELQALVPQLRANGQKVAVVIATDGLPTDDQGYGGEAHKEQFVGALRMLEGFPIWLVIRLCTDEEEVVNFYNDLDQLLELSMEVLDDFCGEAEEVHEHNPWLNYALPIHRMREMGYHDRVFDMLDERPLTKSELRDMCGLLMGEGYVDGMPDPVMDWDGFVKHLDRWLKHKHEAPEQWNPIKKKLRPWLDLHKLQHAYGDSSCTIL